jgi:hypothetical protein
MADDKTHPKSEQKTSAEWLKVDVEIFNQMSLTDFRSIIMQMIADGTPRKEFKHLRDLFRQENDKALNNRVTHVEAQAHKNACTTEQMVKKVDDISQVVKCMAGMLIHKANIPNQLQNSKPLQIQNFGQPQAQASNLHYGRGGRGRGRGKRGGRGGGGGGQDMSKIVCRNLPKIHGCLTLDCPYWHPKPN